MTEKIRALIESGRARATDRNDDGITPLHLAANNGHFEACDYLIKKGADINVNLAGTPLHWAIWAGRMDPVNLKIIDLLINTARTHVSSTIKVTIMRPSSGPGVPTPEASPETWNA